MKTFKNLIGGRWVEPTTGAYFENVNPADTRDVIGRFPLSGTADVDQAVASARRGISTATTLGACLPFRRRISLPTGITMPLHLKNVS
jgi:acyl-CoA reductase-like NAD-dependent aldehyde dehydrogenase